MKPKEFINIVKSIKYKPNSVIYARQTISKFTPIALYISIRTMGDATGELYQGPEDTLDISQQWCISPEMFDNEEEVLKYVRHCFHEIEMHESDEWIDYNGRKPFYPH